MDSTLLYKLFVSNTSCLWEESLFIGNRKSVTVAIKAFTEMRLERMRINVSVCVTGHTTTLRAA